MSNASLKSCWCAAAIVRGGMLKIWWHFPEGRRMLFSSHGPFHWSDSEVQTKHFSVQRWECAITWPPSTAQYGNSFVTPEHLMTHWKINPLWVKSSSLLFTLSIWEPFHPLLILSSSSSSCEERPCVSAPHCLPLRQTKTQLTSIQTEALIESELISTVGGLIHFHKEKHLFYFVILLQEFHDATSVSKAAKLGWKTRLKYLNLVTRTLDSNII